MRHSVTRSRRLFAVAVALCTTAFVGVVGAPAQAAPPFDHENFHPLDQAFMTGDRSNFLSDRHDGVDDAAHLTVVATSDTTQVHWYYCPVGTGPAVTPAELGGCTLIGSDSEPRQPSGGTTFTPVDEAYDIDWDIPNTLDGQQRDIVSLACIGAPIAGTDPAPGGNCRAEVEVDIWLDSEETGTSPQTSSGEIFSIDPDPTAGGANNQAFTATHGQNVPNTGFTVVGRTSPDMTSVGFCLLHPTADAQTPIGPSAAAFSCQNDLTPDVTTAQYKEWSATFNDAAVPDTGEMALYFGEDFTGVSNIQTSIAALQTQCDAAGVSCGFDMHYVVSQAAAASQVHIHNDSSTALGDQAGASPNEDLCEDEDRTKTGNITTDEEDPLIGCIFSQFTTFSDLSTPPDGDNEKDADHLMDRPSTFEITSGNATFAEPTAPFADSTTGNEFCEGTTHDHNADGLAEHCHVTNMGADDKAEADLVAVGTGAVTVDFCDDPDAGLAQNTTVASHGCGDEGATLRDTATKQATAEIDHNHLRLSSEATGNCHAGTASHSAPAGSVVNLTGCAQDQFHNGAPNVRVIWRIAANPNDPAQFVGTPEQRTDATGKADAAVTSPSNSAGLFSNILFCGDADENGVCDGIEAQFQISWTQPAGPGPGPGPGGRTTVRGADICNKNRPTANLPELLIGDNGPDKICGFGGNDTLRGLNGKDDLRGGKGKDVHSGGRGQDNQRGGGGKDSLRGGKHADTLKGGGGKDTARGGPGRDLCRAEVVRGCEI